MARLRRLLWLVRNAPSIIARQPLNWKYKEIPVRTDYVQEAALGPYCLSLRHKLTESGEEKTLALFAGVYENGIMTFYHPTMNGHVALARHERFIETGDAEMRSSFLEKARELMDHGQRRGAAVVWPYPGALGNGEPGEWLSAMGQGHAIAVLARAYEQTGENAFLGAAMGAFSPFRRTIAEGGVMADRRDFGVFFEEYAYRDPQRQFHTLNGMMAALMCLWDLRKVSESSEVQEALNEGLRTLRTELSKFEFPFCSSYDLRHMVAREVPLFYAHYNAVHVAQLRVMAAISRDAYFDLVADRWSEKLRGASNRRRLRNAYLRRRLADVVQEWR